MQENEFEKNLQQKIEALQVQPTEEVWQKIQAQVADKKRSRRGVIFLLLFAALATAGFIAMNIHGVFDKKELGGIDKIKPAKEKNNQEKNKETLVSTQIKKETGEISLGAAVADGNSFFQIKTTSAKAAAREKTASFYSIKLKTKSKTKTNVVAAIAYDVVNNNEDGKPVKNIADKEEEPYNTITNENEIIKTDSAEVTNSEATLPASVKKETEKTQSKKSTENKKKEKNKKSTWGFTAIFSGGISSTGNNYLVNGIYADNLGSQPATGPNAGGPNNYNPSKTMPGFSFFAGIQVHKSVSAKSELSAGLQYYQIKTSVITGQPTGINYVNSTQFLANGISNKYSNVYHFISLPLNFSTEIFSIGKKEICFDAGVNFSKLLSTNALSFDVAQNIYYQDDKAFNKTQIGLCTAIKLNLASKNKAAFCIGPQFYYSITAMGKSGIYANAHTKYFGLNLQKGF